MSRRYCISGAWYSSPNIGDQAILATIMYMVRTDDPGAAFTVLTADPAFVEARYDASGAAIKRTPIKVFRELARADAYIVGGGTPFYASLSNLTKFLLTVFVARMTGCKVFVYAVSTRDLYTWWSRLMTRWILTLANVITIREAATLQYVRELFPRLTVDATSDPAMVADELPGPDGIALLREAGMPEASGPLYGLSCRNFETGKSFSIHHYEQYTAQQVETYWNALARAADSLSERGTVVFVPMNTVAPDDDRISASKIAERMKHPDRLFVLQKQYSPAEAAALFGAFRFTIASRLHATVLSASQFVPSVGLSYGHKTAGFLAALLPPECILLVEEIDDDSVDEAAQHLEYNYERISEHFRDRVTIAKKRAWENARRLATI